MKCLTNDKPILKLLLSVSCFASPFSCSCLCSTDVLLSFLVTVVLVVLKVLLWVVVALVEKVLIRMVVVVMLVVLVTEVVVPLTGAGEAHQIMELSWKLILVLYDSGLFFLVCLWRYKWQHVNLNNYSPAHHSYIRCTLKTAESSLPRTICYSCSVQGKYIFSVENQMYFESPNWNNGYFHCVCCWPSLVIE